MKIVLIGAGSAQFGFGMLGDIFQSRPLAGAEIALVDIDGESLERVRRAAESFVAERSLPFSVSASTDRRRALAGADFVVLSIEVGNRFELWDMDWSIPLQYGIRQVYGENGGPGGLFHALRILPPILEICADVERLCPGATVFCYSNPMTAIVTTVRRRYPELKFFGLCHEIASLGRYLPLILDAALENLRFRAAGLNHCSVLVEASYADSGRDAYPDIMERAPAFFEREPGYGDALEYARRTGSIPGTEGAARRYAIDRAESARPWSDRRLFKVVMERFGLLPITSDSHLGEYIPWAYEAADHRGILDFYEFYRMSLARAKARIELEPKERVVPIMEGMIGNIGYEESAVNLPNDGLIPDLPSFLAVEVPAAVDSGGIAGHRFEGYPRAFGALLRNYAGVYDLTAEAALKGSRDLAIQALLVNPVVQSCARLDEMLDLVIERQGKWLGYLK